MANKLNAKKSLRQGEKLRVRNLRIKRGVKSAVKTTKTIITTKPKEAEKDIRDAIKLIDKAAVKGILKKGNAARKKSRLWKSLKVAGSAKK
jgi:small subunit ribosomal protein S20